MLIKLYPSLKKVLSGSQFHVYLLWTINQEKAMIVKTDESFAALLQTHSTDRQLVARSCGDWENVHLNIMERDTFNSTFVHNLHFGF